MTKFLIASAALMLAPPALAQPVGAISLINAESSAGFEDLRECKAVLVQSRKSGAFRRAAGSAGSLYNQARGHISSCEEVAGEFLIVVRPTLSPLRAGQ